jgi:hypothetical protein
MLICHNPKCTNHKVVPGPDDAHYAIVMNPINEGAKFYLEVRRFRYVDHGTRNSYYLCGCCHHAVQMTVQGSDYKGF